MLCDRKKPEGTLDSKRDLDTLARHIPPSQAIPTDTALWRQSIVTVPMYDTLGADSPAAQSSC